MNQTVSHLPVIHLEEEGWRASKEGINVVRRWCKTATVRRVKTRRANIFQPTGGYPCPVSRGFSCLNLHDGSFC
jgi:hypothetical protein